jgi:predicted acylesterase/phospholipase RssA
MSRHAALICTLLVLAGTGCAHPDGPLPSKSDLPPLEVPEDPPLPKLAPPKPAETVKPAAANVPVQRPRNILALSGGGAYGAFSAGVLNGWTKTDKRPEFDVVTGISTGALIAPMAFLGPKYDSELKRAYTEIGKRDVFAMRNLVTVPFRDAVATSAPLRRIVEAGLTDEAIAEIAAEHRKGRRLYVGTTALDTKRPVVWDVGAIAARGGPDAAKQICDILIASCSIPGVFPPVPIPVEVDGKVKTEMHVDGGVTTSVFVPPQVLEEAAGKGKADLPAQANVYVVVAGKYYPSAAVVKRRLVGVLKASGGAMLHAQTRRDVANLYHMCKLSGVNFHAVALRNDFPADDAGLEFDQKVMAQLFAEGVKVGVEGPVWDATPPVRGPGEPDEIRSGVQVKPGKP